MGNRSRTSASDILLSVLAILATLCSCMADTRQLSFIPIGHDGWAHTDTLTYTIAPMDYTKESGISLLLHTEGYEYKNIAIGITIRQDTTLLYHKQRSYLLSHNTPKNGIGHRCDYTLPIDNITLCDTLPTTITLTQQLDEPTLTGIREVGVRIGSPLHLSGEPVWRVDWH